MKIYMDLFLFLLILLVSDVVFAANHYVRKGAMGDGSGSDWNNAWDDFPVNLIRGDTYYIADGIYPAGYKFDDAESDSTYIYIKKAIASDHGTDTGWNATYGDGQVIFMDKLEFLSGYWEIDGQVGQKRGVNEPYGIVVRDSGRAIEANKDKVISSADHIRLYHIEIDGLCNAQSCQDVAKNFDTIYVTDTTAHNWHLQYLYVHDAGRTLLRAFDQDDWTIELSYFFTPNSINVNGNLTHSEIWSVFVAPAGRTAANWIVRYNYFSDPISTGGLMHVGNRWKIYSNVFTRTHYTNRPSNHGIIGSWTGYNWHIGPYTYNNTFVDLTFDDQGSVSPINSGGSITKNNLFVNSSVMAIGGITSHNAYSGSYGTNGDNPTESDSEIIGCVGEDCQNPNNIFISYGSEYYEDTDDYGLKQPTAAADNTIGTEYNQDCITNFDLNNCITRGADGNWDRGAFEYSGALDIVSPDPPQNLKVES